MHPLAGHPRRHGRPLLTRLLTVAAAAAALGPAPAAPPDPVPRPAASPDLELTLRAKAALAAEADLKGLDLVVSIVDRVAVVGGPVPSATTADRVGRVLRGVPGLADVRVSCWVEPPDDPLKRLVADRLRPGPAAELPRPAPAEAVPEPPPADPRPAGRVVAQRAGGAPAGSLLMDPVAVRGGRAAGPQYPTIPAPAVPVRPTPDLAAAVEDVRRADPRFAGLTADVRGGEVVIVGRAADGDAWDLAAAVRRVPGVGRVALGRIEGR
jgi:hypothetical protein